MLEANAGPLSFETRRLKLRPLAPTHAGALFPLLNDWMVVRMLAEVPWPVRLRDVETYVARQGGPVRERDEFAVVLGSFVIGTCSVKRPGTGAPRRTMPRLGYWIGRRYWGKGYGTEAVGWLIGYAARAYAPETIGAGVFSDNPASRRVLEKLGFAAAGTYTLHCLPRQAFVAVDDMQLTVGGAAADAPAAGADAPGAAAGG